MIDLRQGRGGGNTLPFADMCRGTFRCDVKRNVPTKNEKKVLLEKNSSLRTDSALFLC